MEGKAVLQGEAIKVNLDHADIKVLGNLWSLHPANLITLARARIQFENLSFSSQEQQVSLAGILSPDPREELQLQLKDFALHNFTPLLNQQLAGTVNGTVVVQGTLKEPMINSEVAIQNIVIGDLLMGDLQAQTNWDNNTQQLSVACQVTHLQRPTVRITGAYRPTQAPNSLQLVADFADAQLAMLAPFVKGLFSQLGGELNGKVHVHGSLTNPWLTGGASITNGTVKIDYLNTLYRVHGTISCVKDGIRIGALNLQDDQQGKAVLQGNVQHTGLKDFRLALKANVKDFKGLDTTSEDNEYVYGTAIVSGNMTLAGPIDNIAIDIKATTKSGTRLSIPIEKKYGKQVGQESYIRFVSFQAPASDSVAQLHAAMPNRLALTLALEITPDAWAEIILDAEAGDAIKGRGKGNLTVKIDTEGSLSMSGGYEFTEGDYSFSVYKVVRKKFKILPGGSITWYDKPYEGILHVQAAYEQHATLIPLLGANSTAASAQDKRTYPVQVVLTLQGALASPELHFKVNFPELPDNPDARAAINAFQEKAADERYLTNQVFSLVVLKRFFDDNLANSSSGAVSRSVGELFSQQLSSFASQLDENLEVDADVDLTAIDRGELESLRLKLSYNFFGGRLRIAREGEISIGTDKKPDVAHLVGDWTLEYMLTRDRRLRAKLYNKYIRPAGLEDGKSSIAGGVSLMYVKSFNRWQELLGRGGKASQKKAKKSGQGK